MSAEHQEQPWASWPALSTLRYATWLVAPVALLALVFKGLKLVSSADVGFGGALLAFAPDVVFVVGLFVVVAVLIHLGRGWARWPVRVTAHLAVLAVGFLHIIEHDFFKTTGTLLDGATFRYGLEQFDALKDVYFSEINLPAYLGVAAALAINIYPGWRFRRHRPERPGAAGSGRPFALAGGVAAVAVGLGWIPASEGADPLRSHHASALGMEALASPSDGGPGSADAGVEVDRDHVIDVAALVKREDKPKRNVLVVMMESTRARSTTPYNPTLETTPFLSKLSKQGITVDNAYTVVPHTSKALVSTLCGIYPKMVTRIEEAGPEGLPARCLGTLMGELGYATGFIQAATFHFERRDQLVKNLGFTDFFPKESLDSTGFDESSYFGFEDDVMIKPTLKWMKEQRDAGKPFVLNLLTLASHHKYGIPEGFETVDFGEKKVVNNYLNTILYTDRTLSKIYDGMNDLGLLDNTLIVVVGDHGEGFGEHGRYQHDMTIWEEGVKVPMILAGPGIEAGKRVGGLWQLTDVVPTVFDYLGYDITQGVDGKSVLRGEGHETVYMACWYQDRCLAKRTGNSKFIYHFGKRTPQAYDLAKDPLEKRSLITRSSKDSEPVKADIQDVLAWRARANARYSAQAVRFKRDLVTSLPPITANPMDMRFDDVTRLVGVDIERSVVEVGDPVIITYHFECLKPLGDTWKIFTHAVGLTRGSKKHKNLDHTPVNGRYPTDEWEPQRFVADVHRIQPKKKFPPGTYEIAIGLWNTKAKGGISETRAMPTGSGATVDEQRRVRTIRFEVVPKGQLHVGKDLGVDKPRRP